MNFLESCVNTPLANAVGWALFHSLWQGAFVAAALVVLLRFIRSSNVLYWTACLAPAVQQDGLGLFGGQSREHSDRYEHNGAEMRPYLHRLRSCWRSRNPCG